MKQYKKLVRDNIPDIIAANGEAATTRLLDDAEYLSELIRKLEEEKTEFAEAKNEEELADLAEVIRALSYAIGSTPEAVETLRVKKAKERGGFEQRIFLESVN